MKNEIPEHPAVERALRTGHPKRTAQTLLCDHCGASIWGNVYILQNGFYLCKSCFRNWWVDTMVSNVDLADALGVDIAPVWEVIP